MVSNLSTQLPMGVILVGVRTPAYRVPSMTPLEALRTRCNRRSFLGYSAAGLGTFALASLLNPKLFADTKVEKWAGAIKPQHKPRVKRVIYLYMAGGPS